MPLARRHIWVRGLVQGVFFRATTQKQARALKLTGWVRNLRDGRVEVVAEGEAAAVEALAHWAKRGPPGARVEEVVVQEEEVTGEFDDFRVSY